MNAETHPVLPAATRLRLAPPVLVRGETLTVPADTPAPTRERLLNVAVLVVAALVAIASARPYAGSWNDGSRLAAIESLAERRTLCIDASVFARPGTAAFDPSEPGLAATGTLDKMCVNGHFYSDKSPVPTVLLTPVALALRAVTGESAADAPGRFAWTIALAWSGLAYVVAVWCAWRVGRPLGLDLGPRLLLAAALAFGTLALPYACSANNHLPLLAVAGLLTLCVARGRNVSAVGLGWWAGLAYTIDLGVGPALWLGAGLWLAFRVGIGRLPAFALAASPWLVLHHALNASVGGTFGPANANPEFFRWPGCPFVGSSLTGSWRHADTLHFLAYAAELLAGRRGLLWHALPLVLALPGAIWLVARRCRDWPELLLMLGWVALPWLVYAAGSNNMSGKCCSVRWFVPLLAPGWYALAVLLRERPALARDVAILAGWGTLVALAGWWRGPWSDRTGPALWLALAGAGVTWALLAAWRTRSGGPRKAWAADSRVALRTLTSPSAAA